MLTYSLSRSLSTNPLPTSWAEAPRVLQRDLCTPQTKNDVSYAIIQVANRKSESTHLHCYNRWNHETYENALSIPIYDLSHWHVLACEAHPESSAKCVGTNSVYCGAEAGGSMARTGHRDDSEEFALQVWCEHLRETYKQFSGCPPG
jgi:hypothetical protein